MPNSLKTNETPAPPCGSPQAACSAVWIATKPLPSGGNDYRSVPEGEYTTDCWVREKDGTLDIRREHHRNGAGFMAAAARGAQVLALRYPPNVSDQATASK